MKKTEPDSSTDTNSPGTKKSKFYDFSKACAEKWKTLSEEERQRYKEAAEKDKIRYENEMASYIPPKTEANGRRTRKAKQPKDPNRPKGPK